MTLRQTGFTLGTDKTWNGSMSQRKQRGYRPRRRRPLLLAAGAGIAVAEPAGALLFNGIDYEQLTPGTYRASGPDGETLLAAEDVPPPVREALAMFGDDGSIDPNALAGQSNLSPTQSMLMASAPSWSGTRRRRATTRCSKGSHGTGRPAFLGARRISF